MCIVGPVTSVSILRMIVGWMKSGVYPTLGSHAVNNHQARRLLKPGRKHLQPQHFITEFTAGPAAIFFNP